MSSNDIYRSNRNDGTQTGGGTDTSSSGVNVAAAVLVPLFVVVVAAFLVIFCCCTTNRSWMKCGIGFLRSWYDCCCFRFDCAANLDLNTAIYRYWENPPLSQEELMQNISNNTYITRILLHLAHVLPEFFFSFLPSGSLREGCGKLFPSTAVLATDYDLMLVPDGVTVGSEDDKRSAVNRRNAPTFITTENEMIPPGFVWLSLDYLDLVHWQQLTIPRFVESSVGYYLSVAKMKHLLSEKIKTAVLNEFIGGVQLPEVTTSGPAVTVKLRRNAFRSPTGFNCCHEDEMTLFYCDITIGIHHPTWPVKAANWFSYERRKYWPPQESVNRIKERGCHLVPKGSMKGTLLKYRAAQPILTSYDHAPILEWRYSFSQPELELFDCMPEVAKQAYVALKAVNKTYLKGILESDKNLSYELKTLVLRFVERQVPAFWQDPPTNDAGRIFCTLLDDLQQVLTSGICPHYWIDEINLLKDFPPERLTDLAARVANIQKNPRQYLADNWLELTRFLRLNWPYFGPRSTKLHGNHVIYLLPYRSDPCCMIPCSYKDKERGICSPPCPYDDINFKGGDTMRNLEVQMLNTETVNRSQGQGATSKIIQTT